jgi:hypothetical protein
MVRARGVEFEASVVKCKYAIVSGTGPCKVFNAALVASAPLTLAAFPARSIIKEVLKLQGPDVAR